MLHKMTSCDRTMQIYLGIATSKSCAKAALDFHDGHFSIDSLVLDLFPGMDIDACPRIDYTADKPSEPVEIMLKAVEKYENENKAKVIAVGIDSHCPFAPSLCHFIWKMLDILPFSFPLTDGDDIEERADSAARKCTGYFGPDHIPRISIGFRNEVIVDNGCITLCTLADYERTVSKHTWKALLMLAEEVKKRNIRVSFFNATAQGGGVALMRHATTRLMKLLKISVSWHVPKPSPHVFRITKNNHNLLQGVAKPDVKFSEQDEKDWEHWAAVNCERYWADGPFSWSNVIVLDDHQVCPYVDHIKKVNPNCKIIYRSHIEIRSDLISDPKSEQHKLWNFMNKYISKTDLFISHPMESFIPYDTASEKVLLLPASTDPLDGLNKYLRKEDLMYWMCCFNNLAQSQSTGTLAYPKRPYIVQIARFDPSKGIPDVLEAYRLLRKKMKDLELSLEQIPQLVLCGHGSVDDPDGTAVYQETNDIIAQEQYKNIKEDICVVRAPPEDRILNALMTGARVALQLSHREGFEVKVTEALMKGVPVIAYASGGIPLQLPLNYQYLVPVGNINKVVDGLFELFTNKKCWEVTSKLAKKWGEREEYFTVFQVLNWLWLIYRETTAWKRMENGFKTEKKFAAVKSEWKYWYCNQTGENVDKWGDYIPE